MRKVKIIYNPSSGRQTIERRLNRLCKLLFDDGYTLSKFTTLKKNDAMIETIKTCNEDWDIIIASGGDGTVNEVAKGVAISGRKVPVAILPSGTVNDFANYLKLPKNIYDFYKMIKREETIDVDLGKVNDEYFVNVAAGGLLSNVGYQVPTETKMLFGRLAYYFEGLKEITLQSFEPIRVNVQSEEYSREEDILLFLISNSSSIGGFKKIAPKASISDGLLDVVIIKKTHVQNLASIFFNIFSGDHINHPSVKYFKTNKIMIDSNQLVELDIDGEYGGRLPATFEVVPKAFRVIV
ncbi:MAG: diacylglycerol kinase family lipid kinase [Tissierellia bacterium]|nr:diacylglycerol kinase family lipid kinase [Tissierellia bacterium]